MSGKVTLVGAGPGDPGLLTLRGREALSEAEVVVYDALVSPGVLSMIPEGAELIYVGKRAGNHAMPQGEINRVLLERAQAGRRVVRLKGGDPFLFGRGGEELELLSENGVDFEVVPGVSSALAAPAYSGIPVTHRDCCSSVHFITGHRRADASAGIDYGPLVQAGGTLVFLMGLSALHDIVSGLMSAGLPGNTPAAVLERGTTAHQRRIAAPLSELEEACRRNEARTPALIVVGAVCDLAERFSWVEKRPLFGARVIVTRPRELVSGLAGMLRREGAEVIELPAIRTEPVADGAPLDAAIRDIEAGHFDWLAFTSPTGVRVFMERLMEVSDLRALAGVKLAVVGEGSRKALKGYGLRADFMPTVYDGAALGRELREMCEPGARILIPRAAAGNPELVDALREKCRVIDLPTYDTVCAPFGPVDAAGLINAGEIDYCVFTSASTVCGFAAGAPGADLSRVEAVCIGPQTAGAARALGMKVRVAEKATLQALVQCVKDAEASRREARS